MRSWFTFETGRDICILDNSFSQAGSLSIFRPSISGPDGHAGALLYALQEGEHWISLEDTSDLPFIGIMDKELLTNKANPSANDDLIENLIVVGQEPIFFKRAIKHPLVFPCLARWFLGHNEAEDLIDIGGRRCTSWVWPSGDAFQFRVVTKASKEKSTVKNHNPNMLRLKIKDPLGVPPQIGIKLDKTAPAGERWFRLPTFIVGKRSKTVAGKGATTNEDAMVAPISWYIKAWHNETEIGMITRPVDGTLLLEENPQTLIGAEIQDVSKGNKISCGIHFKDVNPANDCYANVGSFFEIGSE